MAAKLDAGQAVRIRRLAEDGESVSDLATMFEVGRETIRRVLRRETWEKAGEREFALATRNAPSPSMIAASLARVQREIDPMSDEPTDSTREAAEDALEERMRLYREGQAMIEELTGKETNE